MPFVPRPSAAVAAIVVPQQLVVERRLQPPVAQPLLLPRQLAVVALAVSVGVLLAVVVVEGPLARLVAVAVVAVVLVVVAVVAEVVLVATEAATGIQKNQVETVSCALL